MITDTCQRYTERRESRRPAGETIDRSAFDVARMAPALAKAFVERHHYAGVCSSIAHPFGLYQRGELAGVACFGPGASMNAHRKVFPTFTTTEAVTLGRLVLVDAVPGNGESYFIARCFDLLRERGIAAVESCADPEKGHVGTVYQATNGRYVGKTNDSTRRVFPDGTVFHNNASGKVIHGKQGRAYSGGQLVDWGATPLADDEDPGEWLRHWRGKLTRSIRHRGNHRYLWCLDKRRRREIERFDALPYPKLHA